VWCRFPDTLLVDAAAVLPLHRDETSLIQCLRARLERPPRLLRIGVSDRGAVARAAALLARDGEVSVLPPGGEGAFLESLPVDALDLAEETRHYLRLLGIRHLGEIVRAPRGAWERRLREGARLHALAAGDWGPGEAGGLERILPEELRVREAVFEPPVESAETVLFRLRALLDAFCGELLSRAEQAGSLGIRLLGEAGGLLWEGEVRPAAPSRDPALLTTLARLALAPVELGEPVGSLLAELREVRGEGLRVPDLFWQDRHGEERWQDLSGRLAAAGGGESALLRADLSDDLLPERSFHWVPREGDSGAPARGEPPPPGPSTTWVAMAERGLPPPLPEEPGTMSLARPALLLDPPEALEADPAGWVAWRGRRRRILGFRDLGEVETDWWRAAPVSRRYRALRLEDGTELFVYLDDQGACWLQGVFE
ncbi:MAG: hypothetical protein FJ098_13015, partial [Deltaproteobacteria bacterium]|nr:hypothetical protein [Deltaproteobacteria bacterium]